MTDDNPDPEDLLQQTKEQSRTNTPASQADKSGAGDDPPTLPEALADELEAIDAGDSHPNITVRDENMAALLNALNITGELSDVVADAAQQTDRRMTSADRSEAIRQLLRVGLQEINPDVLDQGQEGHRIYAERQADQSGF